jgi:hypothetical protein
MKNQLSVGLVLKGILAALVMGCVYSVIAIVATCAMILVVPFQVFNLISKGEFLDLNHRPKKAIN